MFRVCSLFVAFFALIGASLAPVAAQNEGIEIAFSDTIISTLGYPELAVEVGPDGVTAPSSVAEGYYLVVFSAVEPYVGYLDFVQPPAGLGEQEATELALAAARDDLAQEGWVYAGGSNTFELGVPVKFVIYLAAGEYQIAASYYLPDQGSEEVMTLAPLTVTPVSGGTPAATPTANDPPATITLEETDDLRYIVSPDPIPAGPQLWKITNTGTHHSHHVVMVRVPEGTVAEDIIGEFGGLVAGTPPAEDSVFSQVVFVGYAALQSGGQTTWVEFDLSPGTYAVICYIIDPQTFRPHALDGMVTTFTVA